MIETFRAREIDLYRDEKLIGDLTRLTIVERQFGYKLEAAHDALAGHADTAFALGIALPAAIELPETVTESWGGVVGTGKFRVPARRMW